MRFLVTSVVTDDSFADNVIVELRAAGHEVVHLDEPRRPLWMQLGAAALRQVRRSRPSRRDQQLLKLAREARVEAVLSLTDDVHPEVLDALAKQCPQRRVLWWADPPGNSRGWGLANSGWDLIYAKDPTLMPKLALLGRKVKLLHEAMNPRWHRPVATQQNQDVVAVGNFYAFRQALCLRLHADGVALGLHGPPPPRWAHPFIKERHSGRYVVREEKSRVFGEAMACLNTTSFAEGNSLNCRAFEVAGAGGLQLIEHRPIIEECFEPGTEVLVFRSYEELLALIERARKAPEEMRAIREAGAMRALSEHTYAHRLKRVLADIT